jgi:hypothetical protein
MTGFGTRAFTDPDDYRTHLAAAGVDLVVTGRGPFTARLSWVDLQNLRVLAMEEKARRVAFVDCMRRPFAAPTASRGCRHAQRSSDHSGKG